MKRFRKWLAKRLNRRYRRLVPKDARRLGESRGAPSPNRYVPDASGRLISLKRLIAIRDRGAARRQKKTGSKNAWLD
jgi:hypothetical protein